ncbi:MAG: phosphoenolpyruvate--protein phosphotransferase [Halothiobacillaceae bacterium]
MLEHLRKIVTEVGKSPDLATALEVIARRVRDVLDVAVCSVYLADPDVSPDAQPRLLLQATEGLYKQSIGKVRLGLDEGLVGLVARRAEPINLENAQQHPRYKFIENIGEEPYHAFLGVPIVQRGEMLGVLVVQDRSSRRFSDDQESFLVTLAAQLASAIRHAQASGELDRLSQPGRDAPLDSAYTAQGLPGSPGVAFGTAVVVMKGTTLDEVPDRPVEDVEAELAHLQTAVAAVQDEFRQLKEDFARASQAGDEDVLFDAFIMMLGGGSFLDAIQERIRQGSWAPAALRDTVREHASVFDQMNDAYLRERAQDVRDLGARVLEKLTLETCARPELPERIILVGQDLSASHLAEIPTENLVGIVATRGSGSSHLAILARALGVPAVMGAGGLPINRVDGQEVVVDGYRGVAIIRPGGALRDELSRLAREEEDLSAELNALRDEPAQTPDGVRVSMLVNIGLLSDMAPSVHVGAEGIGLYRTEVPFQIRKQFPGEDEQMRIYREALETFAPHPVVLRTLDVGGDKPLSYFPINEDNPFLGWRGIRLVLDHPEIFLTQLRAMLRADIGYGNLSVLLPMISAVHELEDALYYLEQAFEELVEEGLPVTWPAVGVMVEVPSVVFQMDAIARRVDFISIGTNDLTQYLLAVDRNNERVASLYDALHPSVIAAIREVVAAARRQGKPVSVCGELAGDPMGALLLLGMGIHSLSMSAGSLPRIKWVIRSFAYDEAQQMLKRCLRCEGPAEVRALLSEALEQRGLGGLVRAGR